MKHTEIHKEVTKRENACLEAWGFSVSLFGTPSICLAVSGCLATLSPIFPFAKWAGDIPYVHGCQC